jgi:hypothetical protein
LAPVALVDTVKIVLRMTDNPCEQIAPPPKSQNLPPGNGWQPGLLAAKNTSAHEF